MKKILCLLLVFESLWEQFLLYGVEIFSFSICRTLKSCSNLSHNDLYLKCAPYSYRCISSSSSLSSPPNYPLYSTLLLFTSITFTLFGLLLSFILDVGAELSFFGLFFVFVAFFTSSTFDELTSSGKL